MMERFLAKSDNYYKGPYVSIGLPFRTGNKGADFFKHIPLNFHPHLHQEKAFQRLTPPYYQSTLIATGTGSGKTECFLLPLLEHCRQQVGAHGIKAILIYPMNALATDQSKRIAELIHDNPNLNGKVTAGLYVGDRDETPTSRMQPDKVITDKHMLRDAPPDILLTNYKMLDYLLIQPDSQRLWRYNLPETLRYIIVDEFHTFDGAQGTDLACLLRRLKHRLKTPKDHLACVGTSATLGGEGNKQEMLAYATTIFNEPFHDGALIEEDRLSVNEFLFDQPDLMTKLLPIPEPEQIEELNFDRYDNPDDYIQKQVKLWLQEYAPDLQNENWRKQLGQELKTLPIVQNLLRKLSSTPQTYSELVEHVGRLVGIQTQASPEYHQLLLDSLLSLIATARRSVEKPNGNELILPWVNLRLNYWFRELRRMVASIEQEPNLLFSDDLANTAPESSLGKMPNNLPVLHCRDCGATGWGGVKTSQGADRLESDNLRGFYQAFFSFNPLVTFAFPCDHHNPMAKQLCGQCLTLNSSKANFCTSCGHESLIRVELPDTNYERSSNGQKRLVSNHDCPYCGSKNGLTIIGAQAASLTSAMIGVLYTTPYNPNKKLLAFSDSVQDAAHRAGFYSARTYRTTLRTAIARTIASETDGLSLESLVDKFPGYWQKRLNPAADYVATFLPTDLAWLQEWDNFLNSDDNELPVDKKERLLNLLNERLTWEIVNQFGHRAAVGPSLERSGVCSTNFAPEQIAQAASALHFKLTNEIEALRQLTTEKVQEFLLGLLHHLRMRGGILQPATDKYIASGGNTFLWQKYAFMPRIGPSIPKPIFFVSALAKADSFETVIRPDKRDSWTEEWCKRVFAPTSLLLKEQLVEIIHATLDALVEYGLLQVNKCSGGKAWGIPMSTLSVQTKGHVLACDRCSHQITTSEIEKRIFIGMCCLSSGCNGHYQPDTRTGLAYYREIYQKGEVRRIVAAEHTGLLTRSNRETLEKQFIAGARRCDPNLISATATLEMGIDIGDLSTVILSSVPPGPANFQQRIGRAGRRDGNALVGIVANGRTHDLFFYAEPPEMLAGRVEAAGCYLDASAILQRQLTAFCLDSWIATGISSQEFAPLLNNVLNSIEKKDHKSFPYNWLTYIREYQGQLLDTFLALFTTENTKSLTRNSLHMFMEEGEQYEGGLSWRILDRLEGIRKERTRLSSQIRNIRDKLKKLKAAPEAIQDKERIDELHREKAAFQALMKDLNQKRTLNFFTDEGLLPNYAFPEAGVTLKSILWRKKPETEQSSGNRYDTYPITYERPGNLAIRELVPSGIFYAEGRRVKIDQIDLRLSEPEDWRICRSCNYSIRTIETIAQHKSCPRCGDPMWSDQGQVKRMLRLRQVMATTSDKDSRFGDDSEDRSTAFFQRHLLVDFSPDYREKTFLIKDRDFPFGFEYISRTSFREINLGESQSTGDTVAIAGHKYKSQGFQVCGSCGKVMLNHRSDKHNNHTINCQWRDKPDQAKALEVLYLYREFESESIRFLMPDDDFMTPEGLHSFIAALQLGLKRKFGGQVGHLHTTISGEPQPNSKLRKSFLYLYDTVPGGTGYLRQLISEPEQMRDIFEGALKVVRACSCKEQGKDGCYRCLYAYRNSFDHDKTSRSKAQSLLNSIMKNWSQLKETSQGLSSIKLNSNFESELERKFIEVVRRYRSASGHVAILRKEIFNGRAGYYLKLGDQAWTIETQVSIGQADNVHEPSRADFLIKPAKNSTKSRPIAIFTDGWEYHKDRIWQDFKQRISILRSNQFWCWSLTWEDISQEIESDQTHHQSNNKLDGLNFHLNKQFQNHRPQIYKRYQCDSLTDLETKSSFQWLMHYLAEPDEIIWQNWGLLRTTAQADDHSFQDQSLWQTWIAQIETILGKTALNTWEPPERMLHGEVKISDNLKILSAADLTRHKTHDPSGSLVLLELDDITQTESSQLKQSWNEVLRLLNLYQFLPHVYAITTAAISKGEQLPPAEPPLAQTDQTLKSEQWANVKALVLEDKLLPLVKRMAEEDWPLPEAGYELEDKCGKVIAEAEIAWRSAKVAIFANSNDQDIFRQAGWFTVTVDDFLQSMNAIREKL